MSQDVTLNLDALNAMEPDAFEAALAGVFEHSAWIARAVADARPFASVAALHAAMLAVVEQADPAARLALLRAHPELAGGESLTAASAAEQAGLGLDALPEEDAVSMAALNRQYRQRFGFPFIIAVRGQKDRLAILEALLARLEHAPEVEQRAALAEVGKITRFRLDDLIPAPPPEGWLSVHVLDTARGAPAAGLALSLHRISGGRTPLGEWRTNADGRVAEPLLAGAALTPGVYEVAFDIAGWRGAEGFYDVIPIRFRIDDPSQHYHIPLLLAPFGYSTYRGS
jgi:2-oxo-4-hydroxy-4-carboxy-5-ureidoimidazoline decarboxylase